MYDDFDFYDYAWWCGYSTGLAGAPYDNPWSNEDDGKLAQAWDNGFQDAMKVKETENASV